MSATALPGPPGPLARDVPPGAPLGAYLRRLHARHVDRDAGEVADYIPALADADPGWFGICLVTMDGAVYEVGDTRQCFSIQSISKPFSYAVALDEMGEPTVRAHVGVEPTGEAYNAISLDPDTGVPLNPMVNAGAIAIGGLLGDAWPDGGGVELLEAFSRFAGRPLAVDDTVFRSEMTTGHRNRAVAHLLRHSEAVEDDPERAMETYVRACATLVDARDLAVMGATLANGGVNPCTGERAASLPTVRRVLTVMASCGMYDGAGRWLYTVGLPAKSGVSGGIVAALPGRFGIAVFSPPLDPNGNSVRGIAACQDLSHELELHVIRPGQLERSPIRAVTSLADVHSRRQRTDNELEVLVREGFRGRVHELQGDLDVAAAERVTRELTLDAGDVRFAVLDLRRVQLLAPPVIRLLLDAAQVLADAGTTLVVSGARSYRRLTDALDAAGVRRFGDLDRAREWCEDRLLGDELVEVEVATPDLDAFDLTFDLDDDQRAALEAALDRRSYRAGDVVVQRGQPTELLLVLSGRMSVLAELDDVDVPVRVVTVSSGGTLGETAVLGPQPRVTDVQADTDAEVLVLPAVELERLRDDQPELWQALQHNLVRTLGRRTTDVRRQLAAIGRAR